MVSVPARTPSTKTSTFWVAAGSDEVASTVSGEPRTTIALDPLEPASMSSS